MVIKEKVFGFGREIMVFIENVVVGVYYASKYVHIEDVVICYFHL